MSTCRWCTPGGAVTTDLLKAYAERKLRNDDLIGANDDLSYCMECVVEYHRARDGLPELCKALQKMETSRLVAQLEKSIHGEIEEDDELFLVEEDGEKQLFGYTGPNFESKVRVSILEILKYPYLLLDQRVSQHCVEALVKMEQVNNPFQVYEKLPGVYLLLVHPNENIRRWAILTARAQGKVDRDDYYDLQEVFTCLFKVIELGLFENPDIYGFTELEDGKLILLPSHLYDTTNYKNYWLGICMLLTVLEEQAMDSLLLGPDKQNDFMQSILHVMEKQTEDESTNPFWPALQCFMMILDRLGSKVWGQLIDPIQAFQTIIGSSSYNQELENIRDSCLRPSKLEPESDDDEDMVSCSQIVYSFQTEKVKKDTGWKSAICPDYCPNMYDDMQSLANILQSDIGQDMRVHNSTFLWFIPFVQSVMDLNDLGIAYIMEVIHHLYSEIKDVLSKRNSHCDKVTELFIRVLVSVIELHRSKKCLHFLYISSHKWVEALVKCALIPVKDMASRTNSKISSTTTLSSSPNSQTPSSVQFACIQLIRSLLREGYQLGMQATCQQYLDKLNLTIRGMVLRSLELSKTEVDGLQVCLKQIIKTVKDRVSSIPNSSAEQTITSKAQAVPFIKTERIDDYDEWYGSSSLSPLPTPDIKPAITVGCSDHRDGMLLPVKKESPDRRNSQPDHNTYTTSCTGLNSSIKLERFDDTNVLTHAQKKDEPYAGQENPKKELTKDWRSKLSEVMMKSSHLNITKSHSVSESKVSSSIPSNTLKVLRPCSVEIKREKGLLPKSKPLVSNTRETEAESDSDDDLPLAEVKRNIELKCRPSVPDNLPVSEQLKKLSLENGSKTKLVKSEFGSSNLDEINDCAMDTETDDDIPLSEVKKQLLIKTSKKLPRSNSRDLNKHVKAHDNSAEEMPASQEFCSIERKVRGASRSMVDSLSLGTELSSNQIITISDDSSDEKDKLTLKTVKTEKKDFFQINNASSDSLIPEKFEQIKSVTSDVTDCDIYDSQCFEFETEDDIYSAWEDSQVEEKPATPKHENTHSPAEAKSDTEQDDLNQLGYDTDYICDDDIEKAAEDAERQFNLSESATSFFTGKRSGNKSSGMINSKMFYGRDSNKTVSNSIQLDSKSKQDDKPSKMSLSRKTDGYKASRTHKSTMNTKVNLSKSPLKTHAQVREAGGPGKASLAVVPPKKVRKCPEPSTTAEKLGLKKGPRKAFDLSQRSLDSLAELRNYGKSAGFVEAKRHKTKVIPPQSMMVKVNKALLVSQERQFYLQSKNAIKGTARNSENGGQSLQTPAKQTSHKAKDGSSRQKKQTPKNIGDVSRTVAPNSRKSLDVTKLSTCISTHDASETEGDSYGLSLDKLVEQPSSSVQEVHPSAVGKELIDYEEEDDNLFLTQADPADMELCSQLESEISLGVFQDGDPSNMVDSSTSVSVVSEMPKCKHWDCTDSVFSTGDHCPKHTKAEKADDHLFAKPGLPPSLQKSTKPSTAKIFSTTATSRTASLTKDLENLPKLPTVPKGKAQTPKPSLPRAGNLPLAQNKATVFQNTSSVLQPLVNQSNIPPQRILSNEDVGKLPLPVSYSSQRDQTWLIREVLHWKYEMFDNMSQFGPPNNLCQMPLMKVPLRFSGYDEYFNVFFPLMLLNTFESLAQEWAVKQQLLHSHLCRLHLQNFCLDSQVNRGEFQVWIRDMDLNMQRHPKEDDLVFLQTFEHPSNVPGEERDPQAPPVFHTGHVFRFTRSQRMQCLEKEQYTLCDLCIHTYGNLSAFRSQQVQCVVFGSMITTQRQFKALLQLMRNPLFKPIIYPRPADFLPRDNAEIETGSTLSWKEYNSNQRNAIEKAYTMVKQHPRLPRICIIHGPPGTGKSKTIVGLLYRILMEQRSSNIPNQNFNAKNKRNRVLVCAPSNAALDDLMKKIILDFKEKCHDKDHPLGNCGDINLVRLGSERTISTDVVKFSLDCQVNYRINRAQQDHAVLRQKESLDRQLDELSRQRAMERCNKNACEELDRIIAGVARERQLIANTLRELRRRPQEVQRNIILESHVICCTLSTSGGFLLESAFRQLGQEPFSCVIVDEAGQSCEVETLIPLLHRCSKLVLVGDPEQLPSTVISVKAEELGYGQSLMSRLCQHLEHLGPNSPVLQLTIQYRMHPDICLFPSNHFYRSVLKTDKAVEEARFSSDWPFTPYMVFDVTDGYEKKERESFCNPQEIKMVVALIQLIKSKKKEFSHRNIGVITPYRAQKMMIIEELRKKFGKDAMPSEVDTVDGFQGRQKDCIIVTCVRANSIQGCIGFLASRQRLNVTITRAKYSLFILGSLGTLINNTDWYELIQDAQRRGALIRTKEENYQKDVNRILKFKPVAARTAVVPPSIPAERPIDSSSRKPPSEAITRGLNNPPRLELPVPKRVVAHPAVDIRNLGPSISAAPVLSSTSKGRLQDPRLARRQDMSRDANPPTGAQQRSSENPPWRHPHHRLSSAVTGVKRPSQDPRVHSSHREVNHFPRDKDYRRKSYDPHQAKKRKPN